MLAFGPAARQIYHCLWCSPLKVSQQYFSIAVSQIKAILKRLTNVRLAISFLALRQRVQLAALLFVL